VALSDFQKRILQDMAVQHNRGSNVSTLRRSPQFGGAQQPPAQRASTSVPDDLRDLMRASAAAAVGGGVSLRGPDQSGWQKARSAAGAVGGSLARPFVDALGYLGWAGRASVAGIDSATRSSNPISQAFTQTANIKGVADAIRMGQAQKGVDDRSWVEKANDIEYGFGVASFDTGNKWVDRSVGLIGDVALDPVTYMTGGTAGAATAPMRLGIVAALSRSKAPAHIIQRAAKYGPSHLPANYRSAVGVRPRGLYLPGDTKIPLTGRVGGVFEQAMASVRSAIWSSRPMSRFISRRAPEGLEESYKFLLFPTRKQVLTASYDDVMYHTAALSGLQTAKQTAQQTADVWGRFGRSSLNGTDVGKRVALTHALEDSTRLGAGLDGLVDTQRQAFDEIRRMAADEGLDIGDLSVKLPNGVNFVPHYWRDDASKFVFGKGDETARAFLGEDLFIDLTKGSGRAKSRSFGLIPGKTYTLGNGKKVSFVKGTIDEINVKLSKAFEGVENAPTKWLEDDYAIIFSRYVNDIAQDLGNLKMFQSWYDMNGELLSRGGKGSVELLDNVSVEVLDELKAKAARKDVKALLEKASKDKKARIRDVEASILQRLKTDVGEVLVSKLDNAISVAVGRSAVLADNLGKVDVRLPGSATVKPSQRSATVKMDEAGIEKTIQVTIAKFQKVEKSLEKQLDEQVGKLVSLNENLDIARNEYRALTGEVAQSAREEALAKKIAGLDAARAKAIRQVEEMVSAQEELQQLYEAVLQTHGIVDQLKKRAADGGLNESSLNEWIRRLAERRGVPSTRTEQVGTDYVPAGQTLEQGRLREEAANYRDRAANLVADSAEAAGDASRAASRQQSVEVLRASREALVAQEKAVKANIQEQLIPDVLNSRAQRAQASDGASAVDEEAVRRLRSLPQYRMDADGVRRELSEGSGVVDRDGFVDVPVAGVDGESSAARINTSAKIDRFDFENLDTASGQPRAVRPGEGGERWVERNADGSFASREQARVNAAEEIEFITGLRDFLPEAQLDALTRTNFTRAQLAEAERVALEGLEKLSDIEAMLRAQPRRSLGGRADLLNQQNAVRARVAVAMNELRKLQDELVELPYTQHQPSSVTPLWRLKDEEAALRDRLARYRGRRNLSTTEQAAKRSLSERLRRVQNEINDVLQEDLGVTPLWEQKPFDRFEEARRVVDVALNDAIDEALKVTDNIRKLLDDLPKEERALYEALMELQNIRMSRLHTEKNLKLAEAPDSLTFKAQGEAASLRDVADMLDKMADRMSRENYRPVNREAVVARDFLEEAIGLRELVDGYTGVEAFSPPAVVRKSVEKVPDNRVRDLSNATDAVSDEAVSVAPPRVKQEFDRLVRQFEDTFDVAPDSPTVQREIAEQIDREWSALADELDSINPSGGRVFEWEIGTDGKQKPRWLVDQDRYRGWLAKKRNVQRRLVDGLSEGRFSWSEFATVKVLQHPMMRDLSVLSVISRMPGMSLTQAADFMVRAGIDRGRKLGALVDSRTGGVSKDWLKLRDELPSPSRRFAETRRREALSNEKRSLETQIPKTQESLKEVNDQLLKNRREVALLEGNAEDFMRRAGRNLDSAKRAATAEDAKRLRDQAQLFRESADRALKKAAEIEDYMKRLDRLVEEQSAFLKEAPDRLSAVEEQLNAAPKRLSQKEADEVVRRLGVLTEFMERFAAGRQALGVAAGDELAEETSEALAAYVVKKMRYAEYERQHKAIDRFTEARGSAVADDWSVRQDAFAEYLDETLSPIAAHVVHAERQWRALDVSLKRREQRVQAQADQAGRSGRGAKSSIVQRRNDPLEVSRSFLRDDVRRLRGEKKTWEEIADIVAADQRYSDLTSQGLITPNYVRSLVNRKQKAIKSPKPQQAQRGDEVGLRETPQARTTDGAILEDQALDPRVGRLADEDYGNMFDSSMGLSDEIVDTRQAFDQVGMGIRSASNETVGVQELRAMRELAKQTYEQALEDFGAIARKITGLSLSRRELDDLYRVWVSPPRAGLDSTRAKANVALARKQEKLTRITQSVSLNNPRVIANWQIEVQNKLRAMLSGERAARRDSELLGAGQDKLTQADWMDVLLNDNPSRRSLQQLRQPFEDELNTINSMRQRFMDVQAERIAAKEALADRAYKAFADRHDQLRKKIETGREAQRKLEELTPENLRAKAEEEFSAQKKKAVAEFQRWSPRKAAVETRRAQIDRALEDLPAQQAKEIDKLLDYQRAAQVAAVSDGQALDAMKARLKELQSSKSALVKIGNNKKKTVDAVLDDYKKVLDQVAELNNAPGPGLDVATARRTLAVLEDELSKARNYEILDGDGKVPNGKTLFDLLEEGVEDGRIGQEFLGRVGKDFGDETAEQLRELFEPTKRMLEDGWVELEKAFKLKGRPDEQLVIRQELKRVLQNVESVWTEEGFLKHVAEFNQFWKTYATATPGFHVRNLTSATFMNMTDGVKMSTHVRAGKLYKKYANDPKGFWSDPSVTDIERNAVMAALGAGMGGRFGAEELGTAVGRSRLWNNKVTRISRTAGGAVEGTVRLAAALQTFDDFASRSGLVARQIGGKGSHRVLLRGVGLVPRQVGGKGSQRVLTLGDDAMQAALAMAEARIRRLHFDYSQLSTFDRKSKLLIPFWTFTTRNIPLQITQMLSKPRTYLNYEKFVKNFRQDDPNDPSEMEGWMRERGGFVGARNVGGVFGGNDLVFMPDLQHVAMGEELAKFDLRDPSRMLQAATPIAKIPAEFVAGRRFFNNRPFADGTMDGVEYVAENIWPTIGQGKRVAGMGSAEGRQAQAILNWLGFPVRQVDDRARRNIQRELERLNR
jgi:hypothetical protein